MLDFSNSWEFCFTQLCVYEQVEHVISKVKQRLGLLHRINHLLLHNACLFFFFIKVAYPSLRRYGASR